MAGIPRVTPGVKLLLRKTVGCARREVHTDTTHAQMADVSFRTDGIKQKALKILVIGDMHVGKSSLLLRFCRNAFNPNMRATIGVDYLLKTLTIDQADYLFQIWDTGTRGCCFCFVFWYI